jgi:hypothetical protein
LFLGIFVMSFLFAGRWNLLCSVVLILFLFHGLVRTNLHCRDAGRFTWVRAIQTMECWTGSKTIIKEWPAITTTPDKLFLTGVSGSVPRFASLKTCAVEYVGFLLIQRTGKQRKA